MDENERAALISEGLDPDDPAVQSALQRVTGTLAVIAQQAALKCIEPCPSV